MSYGAFGAIKNTFAKGAVGGTAPVRSSAVMESIANILSFPFSADVLDKSGNGQVIDYGGPTLATNFDRSITEASYTYDGNNMLVLDNVATTAPRITGTSQAHQIPHTEPVTFGFFMMTITNHYTMQLMVSGGGSNSGNYGLQNQASAGWRFQGSGVTNMGTQNWATPAGRWVHICLAIDSTSRGTGSNATEFYINGQPVWTGDVGACDTVSSTDVFSFSTDSDHTTPDISGFMANCFVTDTVLDAATIKALSDESFGHASPYVKVP